MKLAKVFFGNELRMPSIRLIETGISVPIQQKAQGLWLYISIIVNNVVKVVSVTGNARTFKSTSIVIIIEEAIQIV